MRLVEIDAPEKSQAYGQRSKQSLSDLVFGKQVRVEQQDRDRYGRVVGRVYAGGLDVNAEQVKRGMAWVYRKYACDQTLIALEHEAKNAKRGPWADPYAIPPWEYRHGGKRIGSAQLQEKAAAKKSKISVECATCALRNQFKLGNGAGQQELSELNKWSGGSPQHRGSVKPTKPAVRG